MKYDKKRIEMMLNMLPHEVMSDDEIEDKLDKGILVMEQPLIKIHKKKNLTVELRDILIKDYKYIKVDIFDIEEDEDFYIIDIDVICRKFDGKNERYLRIGDKIEYIKHYINLKETDLVEKFRGNLYYYKDIDRDYIVFKGKKGWLYKNFKTNESGTFIDLVMMFEELDFTKAIDFIINNENEIVDIRKINKERKIETKEEEEKINWEEFIKENKNKNNYGTYRYLVNIRKIDEDIFKWLYKNNYIFRDKRNYSDLSDKKLNEDKTLTYFVFKNPFTKEVTGLMGRENSDYMKTKKFWDEKTKTYKNGRPFVRNFSGCEWGFNILKGTPNKLYIFEASIDLLSYLTLYKEKTSLTILYL